MDSAEKNTGTEAIVDHLFRHEAGKMVSVLTRIFGLNRIEIAEDIVQDTFLKAMQQWGFHGIPPNPSAWLYKAAKNSTIDYLRHKKYEEEYASALGELAKTEWTLTGEVNNMFHENEIRDSQLRMIFAACHPELSEESQIAFTLRTLCGFGVKEISRALLTTDSNINKRLTRARLKLRDESVKFEIPTGKGLSKRIETVYKIIYLIFNEGYSTTESEAPIRKDLCSEAIRLCTLLAEHKIGSRPETYALLALMYFHSSRLGTRVDDDGSLILLKSQDRNKWDRKLIEKGFEFLENSAFGEQLTEYHIEAAIAACHASAIRFEDTNWEELLGLYDMLIKIKPSPVIQLNRAIVSEKVNGASIALAEILNIRTLDSYYLYHTALAEVYNELGDRTNALTCLEKAFALTNSPSEKNLISSKIKAILAVN